MIYVRIMTGFVDAVSVVLLLLTSLPGTNRTRKPQPDTVIAYLRSLPRRYRNVHSKSSGEQPAFCTVALFLFVLQLQMSIIIILGHHYNIMFGQITLTDNNYVSSCIKHCKLLDQSIY